MTYYFIRVFDDGGSGFREYDVTTSLGDAKARVIAFLMDGGCGNEYEDDAGIEALAAMHTEIVSQERVP